VADDKLPGAAARIAQLVAAEPDARVREAYVYALGRVARPTHFAAAALLATTDPDPYVRHAAWLAAARMDADRFRDLAGQAPPRADPWDRIGRAYGFLEAGDFRGVDDLLKLAETGDEGQRRAASMALFRNVAPVLESVGRWPVESAVRDGQIWPPALISEVRARLASLDAQRIVNELRRHARRVNQVRYLAGRLHIARDRLAWLLGAAPPREE
jgi:HEAT repeat protein